MGRYGLSLVIVLVVVFGAALVPASAALAADYQTCKHTSAKVTFIEDTFFPSPWTSSEELQVMTGFAVWTWDVEKYNGAAPFSVSQSGSGSALSAEWYHLDYGDAQTDCYLGTMIFDEDKHPYYSTHLGELARDAAHEIGHFWGIGHSHWPDSRDQDNPALMYSCGGGSDYYRLSQDDHAAVQLLTDVSGSYRSATANSSFEEDGGYWEFWGLSSGATGYTHSSGGVDGTPQYVSFQNYTSAPYILSTTALIDEPSIDDVRARANYRRMSSSDSGNVDVYLRVRTYTVGGSACGSPGRQGGDETTISWGTTYNYHLPCTVSSTSWHYCTVTGMNPAHVSPQSGGVEVQVKVINNMWTAYGLRAQVGVDRVRALVDY